MKTSILALFGLLTLVNAAPQFTAPRRPSPQFTAPRSIDVQRLEGPPQKRYLSIQNSCFKVPLNDE